MTATWKAVPGYEGWYEASSEGQIRILRPANRKGKKHAEYPYVLTPLWYRKGYYKIQFGTCDGTRQRKREFIHRVIYRTFHGEIPDGMTVNHIDGTHNNNRPENLELATYLEQSRHARRLGLLYHVTSNGPRKPHLTAIDVAEIRRLRENGAISRREVAARFGISRSLVTFITARRIWKDVP